MATNWQTTLDSVQEANRHLLNTGKLSDVTFLIGPEKHKFRAHQFLLSSRSSVFETLFARWNPKDSIVTVPDTTQQAFTNFLLFLYTNDFPVTVQEAGPLLQLAHKYDVKPLETRCLELMKNGMTLENVVGTYQVAKLLDQVDLIQHSLNFMLANATPLLENISEEMKLETFVTLLESNELDAQEMHVFKAVIKWAEMVCHTQELELNAYNKRIVASQLVRHIRFPVMKTEAFADEVVTKNRGFLTDQECLKLLLYFTAGTTKSANRILPFRTDVRTYQWRNEYSAYVPKLSRELDSAVHPHPQHRLFVASEDIFHIREAKRAAFLTFYVNVDVWITSFQVDLCPREHGSHYQEKYKRRCPEICIVGIGSSKDLFTFTTVVQFLQPTDLLGVHFKCDTPVKIQANQPYYFRLQTDDWSAVSLDCTATQHSNENIKYDTYEVPTVNRNQLIVFSYGQPGSCYQCPKVSQIKFLSAPGLQGLHAT